MINTNSPRELLWLGPFACIALVALGLLRPLPSFAPPARSRIVMDAAGRSVQIEVPYRGTAITWWGSFPNWYLQHTHAPETVLYAGGSRDRAFFSNNIMSWVYPQVVKNDRLWKDNAIAAGRGPYVEVESLLAFDPGAYIGAGSSGGPLPLLRRVGLPVVHTWDPHRKLEEGMFEPARIESALVGHPERGEAMISRYRQSFAELNQELKPSTLSNHPRILMMGDFVRDKIHLSVVGPKGMYSEVYYPRVGVANAAIGFMSTTMDAERILAMDPDIVFLYGSNNGPIPMQGPESFLQDPRWKGMKAVRDRRVYRLPSGDAPGNLLCGPILARWMAEIAHPDQLQPRTREALRKIIEDDFGYRLNDDQIDIVLHMNENSDQPGYERFTRNYNANQEGKPTQ
jgi:iron complex transport system substrate-binding protein